MKNKKGFTLVEIMIVVVIIGLLAAMAIPAFQKVRATSQEKAIINNLRQIAGAAQTYLLESGVNSVDYADLHPTYIPPVKEVAGEGEHYETITIETDTNSITVTSSSSAVGEDGVVTFNF